MKFRTEYSPIPSFFKISHDDTILTIGSCFSENIYKKLEYRKFDILNNPFGIIFHPIPIYNALQDIIDKKLYEDKDLISYQEKWISLNHHGSFSKPKVKDAVSKINKNVLEANLFLRKTNYLFITFGTAWGYKYIGENTNIKEKIVANCHKIPNQQFQKILFDTNALYSKSQSIIEKVKKFNPEIKIIFTLSPVRHLKDGFEENQISKSMLRILIHEITSKIKNCYYFPSYEFILDDLRDYRFFNPDMVHPTQQAIDYVWNKFSDFYFEAETKSLNTQIEKIQISLNHNIQYSESKESALFLQKLNSQLKKLPEKIGKKFEIQ